MDRKVIHRLAKPFHSVMVAFLLLGNVGLPQPIAEAAQAQAREVDLQAPYASSWPQPAQTNTASSPGKTSSRIGGSSNPQPGARSQERATRPSPQASPAQASETPTPSGAISPAPLNHIFDAPSQDIPSLVPNWDLEEDAYTVGSVASGTLPSNYDFETGDLTGWESTGTVSVRSGGSTGYYVELGASGRITSTAFTVSADAQTFTFSALITGSSALHVYVLSGATYGTSTEVAYVTGPQDPWTVLMFDAARWRGLSIKLVARRYAGTVVNVDNLAVSKVIVPQWDGAGPMEQMDGGPSGQYVRFRPQSGVSSSAGFGVITSTAFTLPSTGDLLKMDVLGSSGTWVGQVVVYLLTGANYGTANLLGQVGSTEWETYSWSVAQWKGQSVKLKIWRYQGSWAAVDNIGVLRNVIPNWQQQWLLQLGSDGPYGNYMKTTSTRPITSTAFTIPAQATTMELDMSGSSDAWANAYILSGPDFGTSTQVISLANPRGWRNYSFSVSSWVGQPVKIKLTASGAWVAFDNVGANLVEETCGGDCYPSVRIGAPVDTSSGAESFSAADLSIPGRGVPIEFTRSYFSMSTYSGTLGSRWMHSYEMTLTVGSTQALVRYSSGSVARFAKSGSTFTAPSGNFDTLVENGDGTYTLTTKGQVEYHFPSGGGALQRVEDRNGNTTTLTYSSGRLSTVSDSGGRAITLTYNLQQFAKVLSDRRGGRPFAPTG